jgi:ribosomal protein L7/L12
MHDGPEEDRPLPAAAAAAISTGRKIDAIKYVREAEGLGLMEAKQRVEAYVERDPILKAQYADQRARMKRRLIQWGLIIDVLLIAALLWYFIAR